MRHQPYEKNGIYYNPDAAKKNSLLKIQYDGLLAKSGAMDVYMRFATDKNFTNARDIKMNRTIGNKYEATIQTGTVDNIDFCFKDSANNWDNNNGGNYHISLR